MAARRGPRRARHPARPGKRYSWGYPACPDLAQHEKVYRLIDAPCDRAAAEAAGSPSSRSSPRWRSIAHHPQAVYFGMKSGFLPKDGAVAPDELISGTARDPERAVTVDA